MNRDDIPTGDAVLATALWQQRILRGADECQARALFGQFLSALFEYGCEA